MLTIRFLITLHPTRMTLLSRLLRRRFDGSAFFCFEGCSELNKLSESCTNVIPFQLENRFRGQITSKLVYDTTHSAGVGEFQLVHTNSRHLRYYGSVFEEGRIGSRFSADRNTQRMISSSHGFLWYDMVWHDIIKI